MSMQRMQKARAGLVASQPFFGTLAYKLELVEDPTCKTLWTDGRSLGFNPQWCDDLPMPQLEAVFAHEVLHCASGHQLRRGTRDAATWNDACDHAVNHELKRAGFDLPEGVLMDPQYDGMHAEAIYRALREAEQQQQDQDDDDQGDDNGDQDGQGAQGQGDQGDQGGTPTPGQGDAPGAPGQADGVTGSVRDAPGNEGQPADAAELEEQEADWRAAVAQAAQVARACGKLPGGVERAVERFLNPKVDWREALQRYFLARAKDDYNWNKPNRRLLAVDVYMPTLDSQRIGKVAVAIDMSGSIDQETIDQFCGELAEIRDGVKPEEILILGFDTTVKGDVVHVTKDDPVKFTRLSGGGTAFDDPPRVLADMDVVPEVLVYLTDLDSSTFGPEPEYPVLWVTTRKTKAPFGEVIEMH